MAGVMRKTVGMKQATEDLNPSASMRPQRPSGPKVNAEVAEAKEKAADSGNKVMRTTPSHLDEIREMQKQRSNQSMAEVMEEARRRETPPGKPGLGRGRIF